MRFRKDTEGSTGILSTLDLTPVVDVVFNLLIFFALSLNFAATSGGININLPQAGTAEPVRADKITINLTEAGNIYLNEKPATREDIIDKLRDTEDKNSLIIIRADNRVDHGRVVATMDLVKSEGFSRLAIAVEKGSPDRRN